MARVTVEDCLQHCENRFSLVHIVAKRARELYKGVEPLVDCKNREVVTALREVASSKVGAEGFEEVAPPVRRAPSKKSKKSS